MSGPRELGDLVRLSETPLTAEQRKWLGGLLDEIGLSIVTVAQAEARYQADPRLIRAAKAGCWESVADEYARVLAKWNTP